MHNRIYNRAMGQVFDDLAAHLSTEEKRELLDKIRNSYVDSSEPLHERNYEQPNLERVYSQLSFIEKLIVFLKIIFFSKERLLIVEEMVFKHHWREIDEAVPGMIDYKNKRVLPPFFKKIEELQKKASVFTYPFKELADKGRADFYAFLADIEVPVLSNRLNAECSPHSIAVRKGSAEEAILRQEMENILDDILEEMDPVDRQNMYYHARVVSGLREFALYPYERILALKNKRKDGSATFEEIQAPLFDVINMVFSLEHRPRVVLLEGLFLFSHVKDIESDDYPLEKELQIWIEKAKDTISFLKKFNTEIPIIKMYSLISEDINYYPKNITSGEDWFSMYRQFWMLKLDKDVRQYVINCKKKEILQQAAHIIHQDTIVSVPYYSRRAYGVPVTYEKTIAFLYEFIKRNYQLTMHNQLKRVLIDGEFYKEQNSMDFSEAFSGCNKLESEIEKLFSQLRPGGDYYKELENIARESVPEALKERKNQLVLKRFDKDMFELLKSASENVHLLINVINGILFGEKGGRFDTLSNIGYIGGKENQQFRKRLGELLDDLTNFFGVLKDLQDLEEKDATA